MRICHVSPHLPPDQAANALLPAQLGQWLTARGDRVSYVAHEPGQTSVGAGPGPAGNIRWIPRRGSAGSIQRLLRLDAWRIARQVTRALNDTASDADLLHLHSNGWIIEVAAAWAKRRRKPYVLTLYGTEIWHYRPRRPIDPFTRAYQAASGVTFYSERLRARAKELGLDRADLSVIYPPVSESFTPIDNATRDAWRTELGIREAQVVLNVKRLHPLAGQQFLIDAFARIARHRRDVRLIICGAGELREALERQAQTAGVAQAVTFTGLIPNETIARFMAVADVFVLPSRLEAMPTVAVEALASGTPVISADHPGGLELSAMFGDDVAIVPREQVEPLADALRAFLGQPRRARLETAARLAARFRPPAVLAGFDAVYQKARRR